MKYFLVGLKLKKRVKFWFIYFAKYGKCVYSAYFYVELRKCTQGWPRKTMITNC